MELHATKAQLKRIEKNEELTNWLRCVDNVVLVNQPIEFDEHKGQIQTC